MPDIAMQMDIAADAGAVYRALTTTNGVSGWWTTKNTTAGTVGEVDRFWFPDAPMSWDMRITEAVNGRLVAWRCEGGPPAWIGTDVRWTLQPVPDGDRTRVVFDHIGFATVDEMFRVVTLGWAKVILRLQEYAETGAPVPYFQH